MKQKFYSFIEFYRFSKTVINVVKFNIFVNVYVHYPEVYNGTTIEERLNKYFRKYFIESSTYIKFYTAPTNENQIMVIEAPIDVEDYKQQWNEFLLSYFDHQVKDIIYKNN